MQPLSLHLVSKGYRITLVAFLDPTKLFEFQVKENYTSNFFKSNLLLYKLVGDKSAKDNTTAIGLQLLNSSQYNQCQKDPLHFCPFLMVMITKIITLIFLKIFVEWLKKLGTFLTRNWAKIVGGYLPCVWFKRFSSNNKYQLKS